MIIIRANEMVNNDKLAQFEEKDNMQQLFQIRTTLNLKITLLIERTLKMVGILSESWTFITNDILSISSMKKECKIRVNIPLNLFTLNICKQLTLHL